MNQVRIIDRRTMVLRFARGNVGSSVFFPTELGIDKAVVSGLLASTDTDKQDQGMVAIRYKRWDLLQSIPYGITWNLVELDVTSVEFRELEAIHDPHWVDLTGQTGLLIDAIVPLHPALAADPRINGIRQAIRSGGFVQWEGITLAGPEGGPYEVKEGHGRLIARYLESKSISPIVEVALGTWRT